LCFYSYHLGPVVLQINLFSDAYNVCYSHTVSSPHNPSTVKKILTHDPSEMMRKIKYFFLSFAISLSSCQSLLSPPPYYFPIPFYFSIQLLFLPISFLTLLHVITVSCSSSSINVFLSYLYFLPSFLLYSFPITFICRAYCPSFPRVLSRH
jgi:hypothetical protein